MMRYGQMGLAALMLCAGGCAARGNVELLESQLRQQEDRLYALNEQLSQAESDLHIAQRETETLRIQLAQRGEDILLPEQTRALFRVSGIRVQKLLTGGLDRDGRPGDDLLNVVVVPHDEQGEAVKLPGELEIEVIDLTAPEDLRQLGVWRFSAEDVADHWQSGLTSGFQFRMPWQLPPISDNVVVHARFRTADGRQFGTSAEVHVTSARKALARLEERNRILASQSVPPAPPESPAYVNQAGAAETTAISPAEPGKLSINSSDPLSEKPPIPADETVIDPDEAKFFPPVQIDPDEADAKKEPRFVPKTPSLPPAPPEPVKTSPSEETGFERTQTQSLNAIKRRRRLLTGLEESSQQPSPATSTEEADGPAGPDDFAAFTDETPASDR